MMLTMIRAGVAGLALMVATVATTTVTTAQTGTIYQGTLGEAGQKTPEISTAEFRRVLADGSAIVLDSRKSSEYTSSHIPGARNVAPPVGAPPAEYVAAVERLVGGDKTKALVLYCNGLYCQQSRRLGEQLAAAGFTNVRRFQLGIPMWRALGGVTEIELEGMKRVYGIDRTAVLFDARTAEEFKAGSLAGAVNIPAAGMKEGGLQPAGAALLPQDDYNTRIVVFGHDAAQVRALAEAIARNARHNVTYFPGSFDKLREALGEGR
jgi:rhodanese-related sulfurtransferase